MEEEFSNNNGDYSDEELINLLYANGIKVVDNKKKRNFKVDVLENVLIYKPDEELLQNIGGKISPEVSDILLNPSPAEMPLHSDQFVAKAIPSFRSEFETETVVGQAPSSVSFQTQECSTTKEYLTTTIADISSNYYNMDKMSSDSVVACCSSMSSYEYSTATLSMLSSEFLPRSCVVVDSNSEEVSIPYISAQTTISFSDDVETNIPKRRKHALPETWKKNVTKQKRMQGESYHGYSRNSDKVITSGISRTARKIGPTCESDFCLKSTKRSCSLFEEDARLNIFNNFWKELNWAAKQSFVCSLIDKIPVKQKITESATSKRSGSLVYRLKLNGELQQVCKKMFLNTLGLKEGMVLNWINESKAGIPLVASRIECCNRGKRKSTTIDNQGVTQADHLKEFLENIPKVPSHYCRMTSTKLYLEPVFKSKSHLYDVYKQKCSEDSVLPVSNCFFDNTFEKLNLSICKPKKDRCDICCGFETQNISQEEYDLHIQKKRAARLEKEADKKLAIDGLITALCMDVQSVKVCPKLQASAIYFKTKLCCHNYTIYNMASNEVVCYWWNECEGELQASNFASCLTDYIIENVPKSIPLVIYSDGCTYQNRNVTVANALLDVAIKEKLSITQKYLEKGHTQMECDSVHSVIERKLKNTDIHVPHQYATLTKDAKKKNPKYQVKYLTFEFFKDFTKIQRYHSIRPGKKTGDPMVTDIRVLSYEPTGKIRYKLLFSEELQELPCRQKIMPNNFEGKPMYESRIPLKQRKWKDLQDLKAILPKDFHPFYDNLPKTD